MKKLYKSVTVITVTILLILISVCANAQPSGPGGQPDPPPPTGAPIDGGIVLLLLAGLGFGIKKIYDYKRVKDAASVD